MEEEIIIDIFALDDDELYRMLIKEALIKAGKKHYQIYHSHEEFFKHFNRHSLIAIVDHKLDGNLDGFDVLKNIKDINPICQVIIITGNEDPKLMQKYVKAHCFRYQFKNSDSFVDELVENVNEAYEVIESILRLYESKVKVFDKIIQNGKKLV